MCRRGVSFFSDEVSLVLRQGVAKTPAMQVGLQCVKVGLKSAQGGAENCVQMGLGWRFLQLRIERYFVPEEALREALLNALCHKQYDPASRQISVYEKDKLYIANCGCLPENWTLENLMSKHASQPLQSQHCSCVLSGGFY